MTDVEQQTHRTFNELVHVHLHELTDERQRSRVFIAVKAESVISSARVHILSLVQNRGVNKYSLNEFVKLEDVGMRTQCFMA